MKSEKKIAHISGGKKWSKERMYFRFQLNFQPGYRNETKQRERMRSEKSSQKNRNVEQIMFCFKTIAHFARELFREKWTFYRVNELPLHINSKIIRIQEQRQINGSHRWVSIIVYKEKFAARKIGNKFVCVGFAIPWPYINDFLLHGI